MLFIIEIDSQSVNNNRPNTKINDIKNNKQMSYLLIGFATLYTCSIPIYPIIITHNVEISVLFKFILFPNIIVIIIINNILSAEGRAAKKISLINLLFIFL